MLCSWASKNRNRRWKPDKYTAFLRLRDGTREISEQRNIIRTNSWNQPIETTINMVKRYLSKHDQVNHDVVYHGIIALIYRCGDWNKSE